MPAMRWEGRGEVGRKPTRKLYRAENLLGGASCSFRQRPPQAGRVSCYLRKLKKAHSLFIRFNSALSQRVKHSAHRFPREMNELYDMGTSEHVLCFVTYAHRVPISSPPFV